MALCESVEQVEIKVEPGAKDGTKYIFEGSGDVRDGCLPGDLIVVLKVLKHSRFSREGADLIYHQKISLKEALCGVDRVVQGINREPLRIITEQPLKPGDCLTLSQQGMPRKQGTRGDLIVSFVIEFPDKISADVRDVLRELLPDIDE